MEKAKISNAYRHTFTIYEFILYLTILIYMDDMVNILKDTIRIFYICQRTMYEVPNHIEYLYILYLCIIYIYQQKNGKKNGLENVWQCVVPKDGRENFILCCIGKIPGKATKKLFGFYV